MSHPYQPISCPLVAPSDVMFVVNVALVEARDLVRSLDPCFGVVGVGDDVMVGVEGVADVADVADNEHDLIAVILPTF